MGKKRVDAVTFVEIWQTSSCFQEVIDRTGMPGKTASARAGYYRANGIPLTKFTSGGGAIDWTKLKALALRCASKGGD
jgi:hypothetical protein